MEISPNGFKFEYHSHPDNNISEVTVRRRGMSVTIPFQGGYRTVFEDVLSRIGEILDEKWSKIEERGMMLLDWESLPDVPEFVTPRDRGKRTRVFDKDGVLWEVWTFPHIMNGRRFRKRANPAVVKQEEDKTNIT